MMAFEVVNVGIISCCIMGILCIIIAVLWVHSFFCGKSGRSRTNKHHLLYYLTLLVIILYSLHVILSFIVGILYLILYQYYNTDILLFNLLTYCMYGIYGIAVYIMFALFVLRLDYGFRNTWFEYKKRTIKLLWLIYIITILLLQVSSVLYIMGELNVAVPIGSIAILMFILFIIILFRMFIRKLKEIVNDKTQQKTAYIKKLIIKLNIIVIISIISTCLSLISNTIASQYYIEYPHQMFFIFQIIMAIDSCMKTIKCFCIDIRICVHLLLKTLHI